MNDIKPQIATRPIDKIERIKRDKKNPVRLRTSQRRTKAADHKRGQGKIDEYV